MIHLLRSALAAPVLLVAAVVAQVSLVNRLPLPGGAAPSLVILVVTALAVTSGPVLGMIAGFLGGLALDIAPPGGGLAGENALVCCLIGYGCGALAARRPSPEGATRDPMLQGLPVMAVGVAVAEALQAGLGMLLSDPSMTWPAVRHVLPAAILYDMLLSPFVLLLVATVRGAPELGSAALRATPVLLATSQPPVRAPSALRAAGVGAVPRISFSDARPAPVRAAGRPDPKLRFASGSGSSLFRVRPRRPTGPPLRSLRQGAGAWGAGSGGGPRGSAWLRDSGAQRGTSVDGTGLRRGRDRFVGTGRRDGFIGGGVLGNDSLGFGFGRSSGGFSGALGPSLFAGSGSRRGSAFRGSAFRSGTYRGAALGSASPGRSALGNSALGNTAFRGSAFRDSGSRGSVFRGSGARSGALGSRMLAGRAAGSTELGARAFRGKGRDGNWLRDSGGRTPGMLSPLPSKGTMRSGWLARARQPATGSRRVVGGPAKGWIRLARPAAPIRRATPGRGWLSRKPPMLLWQRKTRRRGPFGGRPMTGKTRIGGR